MDIAEIMAYIGGFILSLQISILFNDVRLLMAKKNIKINLDRFKRKKK